MRSTTSGFLRLARISPDSRSRIGCDVPAGAKKPVYAPYVEHVPPDTTAAIFWLKNPDPAHWRDAWQVEHQLGKYIISNKPMTEEEWIRERDGDRRHPGEVRTARSSRRCSAAGRR